MTWEVLNNATDRYLEKQRLEKIVKIVARHPEWQQLEPELKALLSNEKAA